MTNHDAAGTRGQGFTLTRTLSCAVLLCLENTVQDTEFPLHGSALSLAREGCRSPRIKGFNPAEGVGSEGVSACGSLNLEFHA